MTALLGGKYVLDRLQLTLTKVNFTPAYDRKFEIDRKAVLTYWLAKVSQIQRCYSVGLRSLRIESGKMNWWSGESGIKYWNR